MTATPSSVGNQDMTQTLPAGISVTVGVWLVLIAALVLSRHRRNIVAWVRRLR